MKVLIGLLVGLLLGGAAVFVLTEGGDVELPPRTVTVYPSRSPTPDVAASPAAPSTSRDKCSAAELTPMNPELTNRGLPDAVDVMRKQILGAAMACDFRELDRLALDGRPYFSYSFSVEQNPASFWRAREREARRLDLETSEYLRYLVQILHLPYCKESQDDGTGTDTELVFYIWPRVHCSERTAEDWKDVEGVYTNEQIERMRSADLYYGFRVGIIEDGDWVYFIAGD